jgi:chromosomal replication initiator protein
MAISPQDKRNPPATKQNDTVTPIHSDTTNFTAALVPALRQRIGREYDRWFANIIAVNDDRGVTITVPTPIYQLWIEKNYMSALNDAVREVTGSNRAVAIQTASDESSSEEEKALALAYRRQGTDVSRELTPKVVSESVKAPASLSEAGINPKFTFENYITGPGTSYASAVARAVAEKPGRIYNPLFFYGAPGLGKTHLLQAIGREIMFRKKKAIVRYVTSEMFTNEFVEAIRRQSLATFRQKYRKVDVLLIDDVHFFAGKDSTQEEFFHTFNDLFNNTRQIVLASDRAPKDIQGLEERLVSRFDWGLTTEIQVPDYETRVAILQSKATETGVNAEPWVLEYIAQRVRSDIRRLEGALMRVAAHVSIHDKVITEDLLEQMLRDVADQDASHSVNIDRIQRMVAERYDIRMSELLGRGRPKMIAEGRQVAMYLTREMTKISLVEVGKAFGGRDHGTVIHAMKVIGARMEQAESFRNMISELKAKITSPAP